jgi:hypothetical protein
LCSNESISKSGNPSAVQQPYLLQITLPYFANPASHQLPDFHSFGKQIAALDPDSLKSSGHRSPLIANEWLQR